MLLVKPPSTANARTRPLFSGTSTGRQARAQPWVVALFLWGALLGGSTLANDKKAQAYYIQNPIRIDGELDEPDWTRALPATDFVQQDPVQGQPATEETEIRILYDDDNLYLGIICFDSAGPEGLVVTDIRRDYTPDNNDQLAIILDTFNDNRNGFVFSTNPGGAKLDGQISGIGRPNWDWDGIWYLKTKITSRSWQVEMSIPFKTLRFREGAQSWGLNAVRRIRRKNEDSHWSEIPRPYGASRLFFAGTLEGIEPRRQGRNLNIKPYLSAPLLRRVNDDVDFLPEVGLDVKYGVTPGLTLDLTVNTDFAQVEADEQQINLTRFDLFFPEKRDFFLENAGIFQVGRFGGRSGDNDLIPFFSRRIGISEGQLVPILGGARLTGRAGAYTMGFLSMQADRFEATPSTNFSVVRLRRDVFGDSELGGVFINKDDGGGNFNRTYGADANLKFFGHLDISTLFLKTKTPGLDDRDLAGDVWVNWSDPRLEIEGSFLSIGDNFIPQVGFVPRRGIRKSNGLFAIKPRPEGISWIREFKPSVSVDYITNQENLLETRNLLGSLLVQFEDSGSLEVAGRSRFERLDEPFRINPGQDIAAGDYDFQELFFIFASNQSRLLSGNLQYTTGGFFDGDKDSIQVGFNLRPGYRFNAEIAWGHDRVRLPGGDFNNNLVSTRLRYSFSTRVFLNALIQYNSTLREVASNVRFHFLYKPLSDFFLVYNERRTTTGEVIERALIAKLTYLFDF